jgi:hypothetical protein
MALYKHWANYSLTAWSFDDVDDLRNIQGAQEYDSSINRYRNRDWGNISQLFFSMGMKFNLGGNEEKSRLETTSRPIGVFDFGLASKGLYRVQEYFSQKLKDEKPNRFEEFELPSGVVPPNLVNNIPTSNGKIYVFKDVDGKEYVCAKQQKGTAAIAQNIQGAKLKFATNTKKVYLKFKRKGGKVKYVEIYSLFYYTSIYGNEQFAIRHLPAMMVAEYFESIGIKVRFYMVRFVKLDQTSNLTIRKKDIRTNDILPMYEQQFNVPNMIPDECLAVCPFLVKDFAQEIDWVQALNISQTDNTSTYKALIEHTFKQDYSKQSLPTGGQPDWSNDEYYEGFERFKNKYQLYTKNGIWKSKELTTESQLLFHSMSIKYKLDNFRDDLRNILSGNSFATLLPLTTVGKVFFEWWMKLCASRLKDLVLLQISSELRKDLKKIIDSNMKLNDDLYSYLTITAPALYANNTNELRVIQLCLRYMMDILEDEGYMVDRNKNEINYKSYITNIIQDANIFAEGGFFPTPQEDVEKREARQELILNELNAI